MSPNRSLAATVIILTALELSGCKKNVVNRPDIQNAIRATVAGSKEQKLEGIAVLVRENVRALQAIEALRGAASDSSPDTRAVALRAMADLEVPAHDIHPYVRRGLNDTSAHVRYQAVDVLTRDRYSDPQFIDALVEVLRDSSAATRATAAVALGRLGEKGTPALNALVRAGRDPDTIVRHEARDAVSAIRRQPHRTPEQ